jgi:Uma2 family endonuclease
MATAELQLLTAEQFARLPDEGPSELVRGRIVKMNPPGVRHGRVCLRIGQFVQNFLDESDLGRALSNDSGVITQRGADVSYYSYARLPKDQPLPRGYSDIVPDLVFEVLSPSDTWSRALTKVAEYLNAGVSVVCVVDPEEQVVVKYWPNRPQERLSVGDALTLEDALPGLSILVARLFA